jgi:hypothetical protein
MQAVAMLDALDFEVLEADCARIALSHLEPVPGGLRRVRGWRVDG